MNKKTAIAKKFNSTKGLIFSLFKNPKYIVYILLLVALAASIIRHYQCGISQNYYIYRFSFLDLISRQNLYVIHKGLDYFLYSPSFPILFIQSIFLPPMLGNIVWNLLSAGALLLAIYLLPIEGWKRSLIFLYPFFQFIITVQLSQADNLILALIIFAFCAFEKNKPVWAALCLACTFSIKVYGIGFSILFLMHGRKKSFIASLCLWLITIFLLPLLFVKGDFGYLLSQYSNWFTSFGYNTAHHTNIIGFCRWLGFFRYTNGHVPLINPLQVISLGILAIPLIRISCYNSEKFRTFFFSSLLIWITLFNPKAETSQYLFALTGVAIWFVSQNIKPWTIFMLVFVYVGSSLLGTDLFAFMKLFVIGSGIQAIPCFIVWLVIEYQLIFGNYQVREYEACF